MTTDTATTALGLTPPLGTIYLPANPGTPVGEFRFIVDHDAALTPPSAPLSPQTPTSAPSSTPSPTCSPSAPSGTRSTRTTPPPTATPDPWPGAPTSPPQCKRPSRCPAVRRAPQPAAHAGCNGPLRDRQWPRACPWAAELGGGSRVR